MANQRDDPGSTLSLYRALIALRHDSDAIGIGAQRSIDLPADSPAIAFTRQRGAEHALVAVNCGPDPVELGVRAVARGRIPARGALRLSSLVDRAVGEPIDLETVSLAGHEAVVVELEEAGG